jgi:predicted GNAT family N-acyltransferase
VYIGTARNTKEVNDAILLAANIFQNKELGRDGETIKKTLMQAGRLIKRKNIVIISNNVGTVLACCFLADKIFRIRGLECKGTFLTSIAVKDDYRGQGLSRLLMKKAIEECNFRFSTIAILIARKSVDFFYNKFEFWGVSSYSKISMKSSEISSKIKIKNRRMTLVDIPKVNNLYKKTYSNLLGSVKRFKDDWAFIEWKVSLIKAKFIVFENHKNEILGYSIYKENKIYEISAINECKYVDLLYSLGLKNLYEDIFLCVGPDHPLIDELASIDYSLTQRSCHYGGPMVRVLDEKLLTSLMVNDIKNNIECSQLNEFEHSDIGVKINIKRGMINVNFPRMENNYMNTSFLIGADIIGSNLNTKKLLSLRQFNVLELDQL